MSGYKHQAERMRMLGRQTPQTTSSCNSLQLPSREPMQAEYHRPPAYVQAVVQRHFFPAEGAVADGVGEPVDVSSAEARAADQMRSNYQNFVRRRAAETSKAIKAEQDAKMKMAVSTRERLQTAKAYGVRVAAANSKASPRHPGPGQASPPRESPGGGLGTPSPRGDEDRSPSGLVEQANPPARAAAVVRSTVAQFGAAEVEPSSPATVAAPEPSFSGLERRQNTAVEPASDPQPIPRASASLAARRRMASHSSGVHSAAEAAGLQALKAKAPHRTVDPSAEVAAAAAGLPPGASLATPSGAAGSHAKAVKARVLQPANASPSATGANKWWKGKPLPLAVSVRDEMGLARIAQKVSEMGPKLGLLRLCACPNKSSLFDPHYVQNCARNCPLFMKPVCYESLLTAWLREKGVI